ncbi:hypothetical protein Nepgr_033308 [Nepenthes gracilis]|uniref:Uncharacterized protein n=1 Tax=Nepenthes gracilis TaxID=150966 RepID=A0AAD3TKZ2_NEPGR|nr:hypothetical protein Nepgr_033308 [Nepenthes gracilis]
MADYLIKSLGFSREQAISTSTKVSHLKPAGNPDSIINFFIQNGFNKSQIKDMIYSAPKILLTDVEKTLKPKIRVFQDLGLSGSDLAKVIPSNSVVERDLNSHIIPALELLKSILITDENVVRALKRSRRLLWYPRYFQQNIALLQNYGVSDERIRKLILKNPDNFLWGPKWLENIMIRVEEYLGIPRHSAMFLYGVLALAALSEKTLEAKFQIFKSYGWTESDIRTMAKANPLCLTISDAKIRSGLDLFMKELGYKPDYLSLHSVLLKLSLEKRILPRNVVLQVLKDKKLLKKNYSLYTVMISTDSQFLEKFVLPYKEEVPELYDVYIGSMPSPVNADAAAVE